MIGIDVYDPCPTVAELAGQKRKVALSRGWYGDRTHQRQRDSSSGLMVGIGAEQRSSCGRTMSPFPPEDNQNGERGACDDGPLLALTLELEVSAPMVDALALLSCND